MLEKELERKFTRAVKAAGGRAYKFVSPGNAGVPDRLVVLPGGHVGFVELKQKGKTKTKLQGLQMTRLKALGCFTATLDDVSDIEEVLFGISRADTDDDVLLPDVLKAGGLP